MTEAPRPDPSPGGYEFAESHKETFGGLAQSMSFVGVCSMLFGALACLFGLAAFYEGFVPNGVGAMVVGIVSTLMAWWMMSAGRSLAALVRTRGRDVEHLMEAVSQLRRMFAVALPIVLLSMMAIVGFVVWTQYAASGKCFGIFS
jgi:hypothetical protein